MEHGYWISETGVKQLIDHAPNFMGMLMDTYRWRSADEPKGIIVYDVGPSVRRELNNALGITG